MINQKKDIYSKKLNKNDFNSIEDINCQSFNELKNKKDILLFINSCNKINDINYSENKIEDIMFNNKYLAYVYYKKDDPIGYLLAYIQKENDFKTLTIENLGVLTQYQNQNYEKKFINMIINKSWNKRNVDNINIILELEKDYIVKILNKLNFKKRF